MSPELTLARGTAAEQLLANEAFITVMNELYNQYFAEITESPVDAKEMRENRFFQLHSLKNLTSELTSWVQYKDQLLSPTEE